MYKDMEKAIKCLSLRGMKGLYILTYIKTHPGCNVKQISSDLSIDQITVSIILNLMKKEGVVDSEVQWYNRIYKITDPLIDKILSLIVCEKANQI